MKVASKSIDIVREFFEAVRAKSSTSVKGEPEDQLRAPFEALVSSLGAKLGLNVTPVGETLLAAGGGKPDYAIAVGNLLCGYVELKAPGKGADTGTFKGHDLKQWEKFRNLPNVLYTDGLQWSLYRSGKRDRSVIFNSESIDQSSAQAAEDLLRDFLLWQPITPKTAAQLAEYLAPLCRMLRDEVLEALRAGVDPVRAAAADWRRYLFPGVSDEHFADAYAQTVTFTLLLARSNGSDTLSLDHAVESLTASNRLLSQALKILTDPQVEKYLGTSLRMLQRVINAVPTGTMSGGRRDPWLHFYEDFLQEYDPELRRDAGAYYTPVEVVQAQVRMIDDLLVGKFKKTLGFAEGGVNVLDPAVGTGTYLLGVIDHAISRVEQVEGKGAVAARASLLATSLYGFELMVGPYAVAALRLTRMLQDCGAGIPADGVQIMLNNTLESPHEFIPELPLLYKPIGVEHQRAKRVKSSIPVLVCLGNPPYDRHAAATKDNQSDTGGWVRWGESKNGKDAILSDFLEPVKGVGKGGQLKNIYNLYVYFWRWALWKTFEHELAVGPGIVSFITASSFLDGDAFLGLREHMRKVCDEIWIIDLGGEGRGTRQSENVFAIKTPVAITIAVRYGKSDYSKPAIVHYTALEGSRKEKLDRLEQIEAIDDLVFAPCSSDWHGSFRPAQSTQTSPYFGWPLLKDLMPWQHSGVQAKRTWPIGKNSKELESRWESLLAATDRAKAFDVSTDRAICDEYPQFFPGNEDSTPIALLDKSTPMPPAPRYGFRSFDVRSIIADGRLLSRPRRPLWDCYSGEQLYFASLLTTALGTGPALSVSAFVPDLHFFSGRGAKDVLPLFRDKDHCVPNLHPELLAKLQGVLGKSVTAPEFVAYVYGVLAQPHFTEAFAKELSTKELRVPITSNAKLWNEAAKIGGDLIYLQTYGERFAEDRKWPSPIVKCLKPVPFGAWPESIFYDEKRMVISVDGGEFGPVPAPVWEYEISGLMVVQSWLGYRKRNANGKKTSSLDANNGDGWDSEVTTALLALLNVLTRTLEIHNAQQALLQDILAGELLNACELGAVPAAFRKPPTHSGDQSELEL